VGVGLGEETRPIGNGTAHGAHFDEVEGFAGGEKPLGFCVVDLELKVWWNPWLVSGGDGMEDRGGARRDAK
jgi:hypothetical protein